MAATTHQFDGSIIDAVVESNKNPIKSIERSALIVASASTLHGLPVADLLLDAGEQRLASIEAHSPALLEKAAGKRAIEREMLLVAKEARPKEGLKAKKS